MIEQELEEKAHQQKPTKIETVSNDSEQIESVL